MNKPSTKTHAGLTPKSILP